MGDLNHGLVGLFHRIVMPVQGFSNNFEWLKIEHYFLLYLIIPGKDNYFYDMNDDYLVSIKISSTSFSRTSTVRISLNAGSRPDKIGVRYAMRERKLFSHIRTRLQLVFAVWWQQQSTALFSEELQNSRQKGSQYKLRPCQYFTENNLIYFFRFTKSTIATTSLPISIST